MREPEISVIIPCYNAARTIGAALASVQAQSLRQIEIIVVDDGSSDESVAIARGAARADGRIHVLTQRNAGPASARNTGIRAARGKLISFLDADDRMLPACLAAHLAHFEAQPDLGISFARIQFFDPAMTQGGRISAHVPQLRLAQVLGENPVCTSSNIVARREAFAQAGMFDTSLHHAEDQEWIARVLALTQLRAAGLPMVLVQYRTSPNGLSADLPSMQAGWARMIAQLAQAAPLEVARARAEAGALFYRWAARRALRTGQPAAKLLARAWVQSPRALLTSQPLRTAMTTLGVLLACLPGNPARALLAR